MSAANSRSDSAIARTEAVRLLSMQFAGQRGGLLPLLHAVQAEYDYIDAAWIPVIARELNMSRAEVHGVVTFYHDFRSRPPGTHVLKLCCAESCQARGSVAIEEAAVKLLNLPMDTTSDDGKITLEAVYCLGLCAQGPNAMVDGVPVSRIDIRRLQQIAGQLQA